MINHSSHFALARRGARRILAALALALSPAALGQNLILNGSFELNTATTTVYNLSNQDFNATVQHATAYGVREEIDLMDAGAQYGLPSQHGNWKLGVHRHAPDGDSDEFAFHLASAIVAGQPYFLEFFAHDVRTFHPAPGGVEIGISSSTTSFGTPIFATPELISTTTWERFAVEFTSPVGGAFLTVRATYDAWAHIDNFTLVPAPASASLLLAGFALRRRRRTV